MARLADLGPYVISDEIYHGLVYEGKEHSILEFTDRAFVINGFSKVYAMTGWRLGYLMAPPDFIRPLQKLMQNFFISANPFVQRAGIAALTQAGDEIEAMRAAYDARRRFLLAGLAKLGFKIPVPPTGAFYVFVNARHLSADSYALAFDILEKVKVGVAPGIDFGPGGEGFLRFSYANSLENLAGGPAPAGDLSGPAPACLSLNFQPASPSCVVAPPGISAVAPLLPTRSHPFAQ